MVVYGLLRLQNANVPSKKFGVSINNGWQMVEFWCDTLILKKRESSKILRCFRALSDLPRFYKDILQNTIHVMHVSMTT